ncbi:CHAT domain-containing protein [Ensifer sp. P24N7]
MFSTQPQERPERRYRCREQQVKAAARGPEWHGSGLVPFTVSTLPCSEQRGVRLAMVSATIRIETHEANNGNFDVHLIEEDGHQTSGILKRLDLTTGRWTANVDRVVPPPRTDIVTYVSGVTPDRRSHPDFLDIATKLYDWLLPDGVLRQRWASLGNPRLYVATAVEALDQLPWEMACPAEPPLQRPALIAGLCRLNLQAPPATNKPSTWPFRILMVVGCKAEEEEALGIGKEVEAVERTFHPLGRTVDVHCMRRPTREAMMQWISRFQPHVFHFAGHTRKVEGADEYGLRIESDGGSWTWSSSGIDNDLPAKHWIPTFVFLNACRSSAEIGRWSTHRSFLAAGAKAVLGMQADVIGDLAGNFAATLYKGLAAGDRLEDAMNEARALIPGAPGNIAWALPALTVSERNAKLFTPCTLPSDQTYEKCAEFEEARLFANCREPRRIFTHWAYPCRMTDKPENVLIVLGEPNSGKSHLLKWCMENWAIGGARVRYIRMHDGTPKSFLSILRQIRDGDADNRDISTQYLHAGLSKLAFRQFNWHLNNLTRTGAPGDWVEAEHPETEISDECRPLTALSDKRPEEQIGALFVEALRRDAADRPLVLVFDQLEGPKGERLLPVDDFEQLVRNVFLPIATQSSHVKVAIAVTNMQAAAFNLLPMPPKYSDKVAKYEVPADVADDHLATLAAEMMWFKDEQWIKDLAGLLLCRSPGRSPPPKGLARLVMVRDTIRLHFPEYYNAVERMR